MKIEWISFCLGMTFMGLFCIALMLIIFFNS